MTVQKFDFIISVPELIQPPPISVGGAFQDPLWIWKLDTGEPYLGIFATIIPIHFVFSFTASSKSECALLSLVTISMKFIDRGADRKPAC